MAQQIWEQAATPLGGVCAPEIDVLDDVLATLGASDGGVTTPSDGSVDPDAIRVEQLARLERIKAAACAAQAHVAHAFDRSQRSTQEAAGVRRDKIGRGIGDQIALACDLPASQGSRRLGLARALVTEMPHTLELLTEGLISEWVATLLVRETACLEREDRARVDQRLCQSRRATEMTPRRVVNAARAIAAELDVEAVVRRAAYAASERRVWVCPAPDTMAWVTALLPVAQAVACFAALSRAADLTYGDERSRGQVMADTFVERLTGQATAGAIPLEIPLEMTPDALIGLDETPARLADGTPLPAQTARDLARRDDAPRWLRRIFTDPTTGTLTHTDRARRRFFTGAEALTVDLRDQHCRLPRCDSTNTHRDHIRSVATGGRTVVVNGERLCAPHNDIKELPGWSFVLSDGAPGRHTVVITTPTGHTYSSQAPPALPP